MTDLDWTKYTLTEGDGYHSTFDVMESSKIRAEQNRAYEDCLEADRAKVSFITNLDTVLLHGFFH